ncbi:unnamed protein product [Nippostrongylus brasiliensis]|uniref:Integrase n=1 Tax=Nippostrongylus brasiliensis TaxID=27835 RepID=A0A0N4Y7D3_NIPBR|nr:unnamed protein product [Nippostrongylus brasiliensis]
MTNLERKDRRDGRFIVRNWACVEMDVAIEEIGVETVDELSLTHSGRRDDSIRTLECGHLAYALARLSSVS